MAKILVVDDDEILQHIVGASVESGGHQVIQATDARDVAALIQMHAPAVMILDINMPGASGWDVLKWLGAQPSVRQIPVLMLSADHAVESRVRGLRSGASDYLTKPFAPEELLARLESLLERQNLDFKGLRGDLQEHPLIEVLQSLSQNDRSGRIDIVHDAVIGWVSLARGQVMGAGLAGLTGRSAMLALLELEEGQFLFDAEAPIAEAAPELRETAQALVLEAAWLADELGKWRSHLPSLEAILQAKAAPSEIPPEYGPLPTQAIWSQIQASGDLGLQHLISEAHGSPNEVRLTVSMLVALGYVVVAERGSESPEADSAEQALELERVDSALREVFQTAVFRGFDLGRLQLVCVVEQSAWKTAARIIEQIPISLVKGDRGSAKASILERRSGDMTLSHEAADLTISFRPLVPDSLPGLVDDAILGVVLLWGSILSKSALTLTAAEFQQSAPGGTGFVFAAQDDRMSDLAHSVLGQNRRWCVTPDEETNFTSLLFDLCRLDMEPTDA